MLPTSLLKKLLQSAPNSRAPLTGLVITGFLLLAIPVSAHHATASQFDTTSIITFKGTVSKVDWANPHIHVHVDVRTNDDAAETWVVELGSPGAAAVSGVSRDALKPGATITIKGYRSKNAAQHSACATQLTLPDGTTATFVVGI